MRHEVAHQNVNCIDMVFHHGLPTVVGLSAKNYCMARRQEIFTDSHEYHLFAIFHFITGFRPSNASSQPISGI